MVLKRGFYVCPLIKRMVVIVEIEIKLHFKFRLFVKSSCNSIFTFTTFLSLFRDVHDLEKSMCVIRIRTSFFADRN